MTLTLAAFWLLATNHCKLEQIPGLSFLVCCDHEDAPPHQDNDCDTDGCAAVEGGFYKLEDSPPSVPAPVFIWVVSPVPALDEYARPAFARSNFSTVAPRELSVMWQFSFRAAAPPRAPSLAS